MDTDRAGHEALEWVEAASPVTLEGARRAAVAGRRSEAIRALALAVLSLAFGLFLGPIALARGRRLRLALAFDGADPLAAHAGGDGIAGAAMRLAEVAFALHLVVAVTALPFLFFMLPMLAGDR